MATHASALKAHRQSLKRRERNRQFRAKLRTALKNIRASIESGKIAEAKIALSDTFSLIDKMSTKRIIHDNTAARYKSRLVKRLAKKPAEQALASKVPRQGVPAERAGRLQKS